MAENNLTTAARAVTRNAYGVRINDPSNPNSIITRKPVDGIIDLTDLSASKSAAIAVGDRLDKNITSMDDYLGHKQNGLETLLVGVKPDGSNLPNGITITFSKTPSAILFGSVLSPSVIVSDKVISKATNASVSPSISGFNSLTADGVSFSKAQIVQAFSGAPIYDFKFSSDGGSYKFFVDNSSTSLKTVTIKYASFALAFKTVDDTLRVTTLFQANASSLSAGSAFIPVDKIVAY